MDTGILGVLGGIGLFLFGMKTMTEALREAAGSGLRLLLGRFTTTTLRGVVTGAVITALIQSSTATTVMTVGFVGAGLLGFAQALGVLYGANIGTTFTGWLVAMLGIKLQLGTLALPVLCAASLLASLARGQAGRIGRGLAGLCLLFIGLDMMQAGAAGAEGWLTPDRLPGDGVTGRLQLVILGFVVVVVVQSSSAGVAMALVLLGGGAISFAQAAAMVIGMNLGTTLTALLAALGGARAMRQTALANVLFNLGTAVLAFPLLDAVSPLLHGTALGRDDQTALVLFHTGFNVMGAIVFVPLTPAFARLMDRLVPERPEGLAAGLDRRLLIDADSALAAAQGVTAAMTDRLFHALGAALQPERDLRALSVLPGKIEPAVAALEGYLAGIQVPEDRHATRARYVALLHLTDHLSRLNDRAAHRGALAVIPDDPWLGRAAGALGAALRRPPDPARMARLAGLIARRAERHRRATLLHHQWRGATVAALFDRTDAMRWLVRIAHHAERIAYYSAASAETGPARPPH